MPLSITVEHVKEDLSRAHIQAVAAMAGVILTTYGHDYGVDGEFKPVIVRDGRRIGSGFGIEYQAKATVKWELKDGLIIYDLEAKNFNDLVTREAADTTLMLILLCLPRNENNWHEVTATSTSMQHCCYYHILEPGEPTTQDSKRVKIPQEQMLTPAALNDLLILERTRRMDAWL